MPVPAGALAPAPIVIPSDIPTWSWIDPFGTLWDLSGAAGDYFVMQGVKGVGAAPRTLTTDPSVRGGTSLRQIQADARTITLPLYVGPGGGGANALSETRRQLILAFTATRLHGPGQLIYSRTDGTQRVIDAYYSEGWDPDPDCGVHDDVVALSLYCPSPWFRDLNPTSVGRAYQAVAQSFLAPYPSVSSDATLGTTIINNAGDVEAYPSWVITGPASSITATLNSTGQTWTIDPNAAAIGHGNLLAGETVTFTTDPFSVVGPAGQTWTGALNWPTATAWPLLPGNNSVTYTVTGSGTGTTITVNFFQRYESI